MWNAITKIRTANGGVETATQEGEAVFNTYASDGTRVSLTINRAVYAPGMQNLISIPSLAVTPQHWRALVW